jgi:hypothetical protein
MAEALGAVSASLALVILATKVVKFFSDMSTGFKDADGKAKLIHEDLYNFKLGAKFAHNNLDHLKVDDLGLKQCLVKYEVSIAQLGHKMQAIHGKKRLWGQTKKWMELMSSDSEVAMLRQHLKQHLKQHTSELTEKFTLAMLQEIKGDVKEIKTDVRANHAFNMSAHQSVMLWQQSSDERLDTIEAKLDAAIGLQTPKMSPFHLDDDDLFDLDLESPPLSPSPPASPRWCVDNLVRRNSTDSYAMCEASSCYAVSINSTTTSNGGGHQWVSGTPAS